LYHKTIIAKEMEWKNPVVGQVQDFSQFPYERSSTWGAKKAQPILDFLFFFRGHAAC